MPYFTDYIPLKKRYIFVSLCGFIAVIMMHALLQSEGYAVGLVAMMLCI
jgi:hypothetical protein